MELSKLDTRTASTAGRDMVVVGPDGEKTDIVLTIIGPDSTGYARATREAQLALKDMPADDNVAGQIDKMEASTKLKIINCIIGMTGLTDGDKKLAFSRKNVEALIHTAPYISFQVLEFINDRSNFLTTA